MIELSLGRPDAGDPDRDRLRRVPRLPAPQLLPGADLHGRLGRAAARLHARGRVGRGPAQDRGPRDARAAAARARVPLLDTSFVVAKRIKHGQPVYVADRKHLHHRLETSASRSAAPSSTSTPGARCSPLAALATRFVHPHRHGDWDLANAAIDAAVGLLAIGASVYVVYLLEIVKLANPFIRRREERKRDWPAQDCLIGWPDSRTTMRQSQA